MTKVNLGIDPDVIEQACIAFLSGIAKKIDNEIEWEANECKIFIEIIDVEKREALIKWKMKSGYWESHYKSGKTLSLKWKTYG